MRALLALALLAAAGRPLRAQAREGAAVDTLVARAVEARMAARAEPALHRHVSRAEGMLFFLAEFGDGAEPRLIKADQLAVEVYWEAPNRSKQIVTAWRERRDLPTDIRYHRDHLGMVTDEFGDAIRLGDGDEVLDVPHPLSRAGRSRYRFRLADSLTIAGTGRSIRVHALQVRPIDPAVPGVVGTLYLDVETGALVQFRFGFTASAFRQPDLEAISVVLENALLEQRWWLPFRQEIEIRRRTAWLEVPIRTIIRGRWTIGDYEIGRALPPGIFAGGAYGGLRQPDADAGPWEEPMDEAVRRTLGPVLRADLEGVRRTVGDLVGAAAEAGPPARLALGSLSDLVRVNRVQGFTVGAGTALRVGRLATLRLRGAYGTADGQLTSAVAVERPLGGSGTRLVLGAERTLADVAAWPVASGLLNSFLAQEGPQDFGDYVRLERLAAEAVVPWGSQGRVTVGARLERSVSVATDLAWAARGHRANPSLGVGEIAAVRAGYRIGGRRPDAALASGLVEVGWGDRRYARLMGEGALPVPAGPGMLVSSVRVALATEGVPPYLTTPLGGRGTLVGEAFRAFGGRQAGLARLEWRVPVRLPWRGDGLPGVSGRNIVVAPFVAGGVAWGESGGGPWVSSEGMRPVLGVASELLFGVVRVEAAWAPSARRVGVVVDASPAWWGVL